MMAIGINCLTSTEKSMSRGYQDVLFYIGAYDFDGEKVTHHLKNGSLLQYLGKDLIRPVRMPDPSTLILVAKSGGVDFYLTWKRVSK